MKKTAAISNYLGTLLSSSNQTIEEKKELVDLEQFVLKGVNSF
jgi:hypothetical protein